MLRPLQTETQKQKNVTNRTYETMVLLDNQEVKRNWNALKDQVCGLFTKHGASIRSAKVWEERRLAYPIERQLRATYFLVYHDSPTDQQTALTRDLEYAEPVLRHLTVACEEVPAEALEGEDDFDPEAIRVESVETAMAEAQANAEAGDDDAEEDAKEGAEEGAAEGEGETKDEESKDGESSEGETKSDDAGESSSDDAEETKE